MSSGLNKACKEAAIVASKFTLEILKIAEKYELDKESFLIANAHTLVRTSSVQAPVYARTPIEEIERQILESEKANNE